MAMRQKGVGRGMRFSQRHAMQIERRHGRDRRRQAT
jgi:hypothetical protein